MISGAIAGLDRQLITGRVTPLNARPPGRFSGVITFASLLVVTVLAITRGVTASPATPSLAPAVRPTGVVAESSRFVHVYGDSVRQNGYFMVTAITSKQVAAGKSAMLVAQRDALTAASACIGIDKTERVTLTDGGVTGGSAGLLFALTVVDAFGDSDLTAGRRIAATGTISPNGIVGEVVGVALKAQAAERAHADVFFVPASQVVEAVAATQSLRVVGVRTLDEAVRSLV